MEGAPQDANIPWERSAIFATRTKVGAGQVTVARELLRGFTLAMPDQYPGLRDFYQKMAAEDQQQLVLSAPITTKGN